LKEEIKAFVVDEHIAKRAEEKFPDRITYFDINATNVIGFGFKKLIIILYLMNLMNL